MLFDSLRISSTYLVDFKGSCFSHPYNGPVLVTGFNPKGYEHLPEVVEVVCDDGEGGVFTPEDFISEVKCDEFKQNILSSLNVSDMVFELVRRKLEGKKVKIEFV